MLVDDERSDLLTWGTNVGTDVPPKHGAGTDRVSRRRHGRMRVAVRTPAGEQITFAELVAEIAGAGAPDPEADPAGVRRRYRRRPACRAGRGSAGRLEGRLRIRPPRPDLSTGPAGLHDRGLGGRPRPDRLRRRLSRRAAVGAGRAPRPPPNPMPPTWRMSSTPRAPPGVPKGVAIEHRALANLLTAMAERPGFAVGEEARSPSRLSPST